MLVETEFKEEEDRMRGTSTLVGRSSRVVNGAGEGMPVTSKSRPLYFGHRYPHVQLETFGRRGN